VISKLAKDKLRSPYFLHPFFMGKKTSFPDRKKAGVYLIYKGKKLHYVGFSKGDVYKALYRHFQSWRDKTQIRITYNPDAVKVRVVYCNNATTAGRLEKALIIKYKPIDNPQQYSIKYDIDEKELEVLKIYIQTKEIDYTKDENFPF